MVPNSGSRGATTSRTRSGLVRSGPGAGAADQIGGWPASADHPVEGTTAAIKNAAIHTHPINRDPFVIVERQEFITDSMERLVGMNSCSD
jgi:hypothetical protein